MTETEVQSIKITADPKSQITCHFTVDQPVYPDSSFYFGSKERAQGSPLAQRLLEIAGVTSVLIAHNRITVNKADSDEWLPVARQVGAAVRAHIATGQPAVSEDLRNSIAPE